MDANLEPIGKDFYFGGDWRTEPGTWKVLGYDQEMDSYLCEPDKENRIIGHSNFWGTVVRSRILRPSPSRSEEQR
jgi:hypothetical protein